MHTLSDAPAPRPARRDAAAAPTAAARRARGRPAARPSTAAPPPDNMNTCAQHTMVSEDCRLRSPDCNMQQQHAQRTRLRAVLAPRGRHLRRALARLKKGSRSLHGKWLTATPAGGGAPAGVQHTLPAATGTSRLPLHSAASGAALANFEGQAMGTTVGMPQLFRRSAVPRAMRRAARSALRSLSRAAAAREPAAAGGAAEACTWREAGRRAPAARRAVASAAWQLSAPTAWCVARVAAVVRRAATPRRRRNPARRSLATLALTTEHELLDVAPLRRCRTRCRARRCTPR